MHEAKKIKLITAALMAGHYLEKLSRTLTYKFFMDDHKKNITGLTASIMCFDTEDHVTAINLYNDFKDCYDFDLNLCKSRLLEAKQVLLENENKPIAYTPFNLVQYAETVAIAKTINFDSICQ